MLLGILAALLLDVTIECMDRGFRLPDKHESRNS
jgi:hypothetical protein